MNIGVILCYVFDFTEEVYQKSSALHSFEKLYSQAMQLQVQVEHDLWGLLWPLYPHPRLSWPSFLGLVMLDLAADANTHILGSAITTDALKWLVRACLTSFAVCLVEFFTSWPRLISLTNQLWHSNLLFLKLLVFFLLGKSDFINLANRKKIELYLNILLLPVLTLFCKQSWY